jgi:hypothetical protein
MENSRECNCASLQGQTDGKSKPILRGRLSGVHRGKEKNENS